MRYQVPVDAGGLTLGKFLYGRLKLSNTLVRRAKNAGGLLVDGQPARVGDRLAGGEEVEIRVAAAERVAPEPVPLTLVFADAYLLVVDKPPGMVVHPVKGYTSGTLANGVAYHLQERGEAAVVRPVLRIDRDTSGLVLFAKDPVVAQRLARELGKQKLERRYIGFVAGVVEPAEGMVDLPIRRVWGHPVAREVALGPRTPDQEALLAAAEAQGRVRQAEWTAGGQRAVTHWEVTARWQAATLLTLRLETGRTHQIRVHMAHTGHPLLGDEMYGDGGPPGRQALHAATLAFTHPMTGESLRFESPLPPDLADLAERLTITSS